MSKASVIAFGIMIIALAPLALSAQAVNTSASVQESFLTELQSLQQELASLSATINAMIAASGGTPPASSASTPTTSGISILPIISPASLEQSGSGSMDFSGQDLSSELLQAITTPVASSSFVQNVVANTTNTTSTMSTAATAQLGTAASQFDPACISGLFAQGAQCGGLYYCGAGISGGYWSATACTVEVE